MNNLIIPTVPGVYIKWFMVAGLLMYTFFTVAVTRQVAIMTETVDADINPLVRAFAWVYFLGSAILLILALVWL